MHIIGCLKTFFTRPWVRAIQSEKLVMPIDLLFAFGYKMSVTGSNVIRSKLHDMFSGSLLFISKKIAFSTIADIRKVEIISQYGNYYISDLVMMVQCV